MQIELENIGLIKEAKVNIDGLTVIAGENDTGKSTVGKALMALIKADNTARHKFRSKQSHNFIKNREKSFNKQIELLFDDEISEDGRINLEDNKNLIYGITIKNNICTKFQGLNATDKRSFLDCTFLQTPIIWDLYDFFMSISIMRTEDEIYGFETNIQYPYILWDLYTKLSKKRHEFEIDKGLLNTIKNIVNGSFVKDKNNRFYYSKNNLKIPMTNTAIGVKSFGIIQILLQNCYINKYGFLILDEPEIHLHPKWQLELAKIIIELVKGDIKILVNSHSPYMIEALKRYSEIENLNDRTNFYLAQNGYIIQQDNLENIFKKLAIPMRELKNLKIKQYANN
jgi:predicted ATPase